MHDISDVSIRPMCDWEANTGSNIDFKPEKTRQSDTDNDEIRGEPSSMGRQRWATVNFEEAKGGKTLKLTPARCFRARTRSPDR